MSERIKVRRALLRPLLINLRVICIAVVLAGVSGCEKKQQCPDTSAVKDELTSCKKERDELQQQVNDLKMKLAQALVNPGKVEVDPSVLMIDGEPIKQNLQEGTLSQNQVVPVMRRGRGSLRECYTRALKRNSALHHGAISLTLSFKIKNNGKPSGISIRPSRDAQMTDCMIKAIKRWTFPEFQGQPVGVESPVTLTPKS